MDNFVKFSGVELFLIEMALDQTLYTISDTNSPIYKKFELIDQKIFGLRKSVEESESAEIEQLSEYELNLFDDAIKELSNLLQKSNVSDTQNRSIRLGIAAITACEDNKISILSTLQGDIE